MNADGSSLLLNVVHLKKYFPVAGGLFSRGHGVVKAVDDVSFSIPRGKTLGLIGESGCGKSTTGRTILRAWPLTDGKVIFDGTDLSKLSGTELRKMRTRMQMIFQDPFMSLNPRMSVGDMVREPLIIHRIGTPQEQEKRTREMFDMVGLPQRYMSRYPHEFSGGQRQRVGIARALILKPDLVVCDEPIAALDVSIQAQIVNLLCDLQRTLGLSYLFIAHDLSMVRYVSDQIAVMYLGKIVELTNCESIYKNPLHPYTKALVAAVPVPDPRLEAAKARASLGGELPSPSNPPAGCRFCTRCPYATDLCRTKEPALREVHSGQFVACHYAEGKS